MRKLKLYIAISLDAKIAKVDGDVAWLEEIPNPAKTDYGYAAFYESIDTTLMGYNTYAMIEGFDIPFPYPDKRNYVFSRKKTLKNTGFVEFISKDIVAFVQKLKEQEGKDIWLVGGSNINTQLINADLVNEIHIFVMPIILGAGISLFSTGIDTKKLNLLSQKTYSSGAIGLVYSTD